MHQIAQFARKIPEPALLRKAWTWLLGLALAVMLGGAFGELASDVWTGEGFAYDQALMMAVHSLASPWLTAVMRVITTSASGLVAVGVALVLAGYWWRQVGRWAEAVVLLATLAGSAVVGQGLKILLACPRPHLFPWLTAAGGWSFPSGHTLTAIVLGGMLAWLLGQKLTDWRRAAVWAVAGLWAGLVGLSRVYLGVHYPSDVLASLAVGGIVLLAAIGTYRAILAQSPNWKRSNHAHPGS